MRDEVNIIPFSVRCLRKTKCSKRPICLGNVFLSFVNQVVNSWCAIKSAGGRWKMRVEDRWAENAIFHQSIMLYIK
ncbi:hypothetical protein FDF36_14300 [Bacteroides fragilis]|nr:hypothetical protein [Bacteroides fragilis]QCQ31105.1 hypothetical protein IB64_005365 [Bacteroides fragilis]